VFLAYIEPVIVLSHVYAVMVWLISVSILSSDALRVAVTLRTFITLCVYE
jgi:hypothetical protein